MKSRTDKDDEGKVWAETMNVTYKRHETKASKETQCKTKLFVQGYIQDN